MKTTPEKLVELKTMAEHAKSHFCVELAEAFANSVPDLIADLEEAKEQLAEAQSRDGSIAPVAAIKFSLKTDCGDQFLRWWVEGSFDAIRSEWPEVPEAVFIGADPLHPNTQQTSTAALDAAIAEAIADEKRNPWKQAIINELIVSHILRTDHETDPIKALAALVDYECKVALDPAVSKEAQELIEPYRKDAERLDLLGKLCKETPLRPNAFCSEIAPDTRLKYEFPTLVSYDAIGQQTSLRDAIDAAIAAKGESE